MAKAEALNRNMALKNNKTARSIIENPFAKKNHGGIS
jgi:hypothetical protein